MERRQTHDDTTEAGPSEPAPSTWLRAIDNTYAIFEDSAHRTQYGALADKVQTAVRLCEEVLDELSIGQCALSFNGGKDCTVLVHMLAAVLRRRRNSHDALDDQLACIPALYILCTSPFDEVEEFVVQSIRRYNLRLVRQAGGMKQGLELYLNGVGDEEAFEPDKAAVQAHPRENGDGDGDNTTDGASQPRHQKRRDVKAIFVGTRRTDPHGADLTPRKHTDAGWPDVERVQPILDWSYHDVWDFLRCPLFAVKPSEVHDERRQEWGATYGVPYCSLYDEGYTSLGSTYNTFPNPHLDTRNDGKDQHHQEQQQQPLEDRRAGRWRPAYLLQDEAHERAGRAVASS